MYSTCIFQFYIKHLPMLHHPYPSFQSQSNSNLGLNLIFSFLIILIPFSENSHSHYLQCVYFINKYDCSLSLDFDNLESSTSERPPHPPQMPHCVFGFLLPVVSTENGRLSQSFLFSVAQSLYDSLFTQSYVLDFLT